MTPKSQIQKNYTNLAGVFDRFERSLGRLLLGRLKHVLLAKMNGIVLEVAIGTGANMSYYPPNCRIYGIDLSLGMLKVAQKRIEHISYPVPLLLMDAENLAFTDNCFDTVLCTLALCTIPNPIQALREIKRVLKPGGKILLLEHVSNGSKYFKLFQALLAQRFLAKFGCHLQRQTVDNIRRAGFEINLLQYHFWKIVVLIEATIT
ncbi:class I SAM-dependent methyltransferase [bacterium]|nr:class I SAM-dependent methyltransferase [bacterium]